MLLSDAIWNIFGKTKITGVVAFANIRAPNLNFIFFPFRSARNNGERMENSQQSTFVVYCWLRATGGPHCRNVVFWCGSIRMMSGFVVFREKVEKHLSRCTSDHHRRGSPSDQLQHKLSCIPKVRFIMEYNLLEAKMCPTVSNFGYLWVCLTLRCGWTRRRCMDVAYN